MLHLPLRLAAPPVQREWLTVLLSVVPGARAVPVVETAEPGKEGPGVGVVLAENPGGGGGREEAVVLLAVVEVSKERERERDQTTLVHKKSRR